MNLHGIGYKQTWYPPDVRYWWETLTKLFLSNIINHGKSDVQWPIWIIFGISVWKEKVALITSLWHLYI